MNTALITGNTFPVKDQIRALGGRWDAAAKGWRVPVSAEVAARRLVSTGPSSAAQRSAPARRVSSLGARTGCACGSREGGSQSSDCRSCRFDGDEDG